MKVCFVLFGVCLLIFLFSPFRNIALDVFFDKSSSKQEVTTQVDNDNNETKKENGIFKNEDGEIVEIHLSETESKDKVPDGWTVVAKKYDPYSDKWLDVYQQSITPTIFKEKFNKISAKTIGEDNFLIKDIKIQNGEKNNVFQVKFNEGMIINGVLNSKNEIISLVALLEDDGGPETGPYNTQIREALIKIFSPTITDEELLSVLDKLKFITSYSELQNQVGKSFNETIGDIKYNSDFMKVANGNVLCILALEVSE